MASSSLNVEKESVTVSLTENAELDKTAQTKGVGNGCAVALLSVIANQPGKIDTFLNNGHVNANSVNSPNIETEVSEVSEETSLLNDFYSNDEKFDRRRRRLSWNGEREIPQILRFSEGTDPSFDFITDDRHLGKDAIVEKAESASSSSRNITNTLDNIHIGIENDISSGKSSFQRNVTNNEKIVDLNFCRENYDVTVFAQSHSTTPTGSCLRAGSKSGGSIRVQFETPRNGRESLISEASLLESGKANSQNESDAFTFFNHPDSEEITPGSSLRKNRKKRGRYLSGSSTTSISSSSTSTNESKTTEFERRAPDGGWGWVIVFASFMVHCIADGVTMSFGLIYVEFLSYFQESKSLTSWIGSLFMAIPLLAGPLASLLTDRYGCRTVTIWGSIISCLGFFLSAFADSILVLLFTVGVVTGLGLAACYVAAIVVVAFYFERYRSLATGVAVAGSGIGTFIFAPIIQYLLETYGWRGCMIILAGIFLNMTICGALMRDLEWTRKENRQSSTNTSSTSRQYSITQSSDTLGARGNVASTRTIPSLEELKRLVQSGEIVSVFSQEENSRLNIIRSESLVHLPTFLNKSVIPKDLLPCLASKANAYEVVSNIYPHLLSRSLSVTLNQPEIASNEATKQINHPESSTKEFTRATYHPKVTREVSRVKLRMCADESFERGDQIHDIENDHLPSYCIVKQLTQNEDEITNLFGKMIAKECDTSSPSENGKNAYLKRSSKTTLRQVDPKSISASCVGGVTTASNPAAPLRDMRVPRQSMTYRGAMLNIHRYRLRASSCPNILRNSIITIAATQNQNVWSYTDDFIAMLSSCVNLHYCKDGPYLLFALSNFILYVFYDTVYLYLTDYSLGVGISADAGANLISAIGILNCLGMVLMGYLGDQPWSSPMLIYEVSMILCGLSVLAMPFIRSYWALAAASAAFGLFISANYALTAVILVQLISLEAFSKSYGLLLLIQGLANLVGPPLVGLMADATGEYLIPFVLSGIFIVVCGMMLSLIPLIERCSNRHSPNSSTDSSPRRSPSIAKYSNGRVNV